jgi:hypothetical protein
MVAVSSDAVIISVAAKSKDPVWKQAMQDG